MEPVKSMNAKNRSYWMRMSRPFFWVKTRLPIRWSTP
jgi:hypothetical protein